MELILPSYLAFLPELELFIHQLNELELVNLVNFLCKLVNKISK